MRLRAYGKVAIFDSAGRVLVLRRSATHPKKAGEWDLPGGIARQGERVLAAARREVTEETGLSLDTITAIATHAEVEPDSSLPGTLVCCAGILATASVRGDATVRLSSEHDAYAWLATWSPRLAELKPKYEQLVKASARYRAESAWTQNST